MHVERATTGDAQVVAMLNQHVHLLHAEAEPDDFHPTKPEEAEPFFTSLLASDDHVVFVANFGDQPVGYVWAEEVHRPDNPFTTAARTLYIHHIAVAPPARRQGVGQTLFAAVEDEARRRGIARLGLDHWTFNKDASRFFGRLGFTPYNVRMRRDVGPPERGALAVRSLVHHGPSDGHSQRR